MLGAGPRCPGSLRRAGVRFGVVARAPGSRDQLTEPLQFPFEAVQAIAVAARRRFVGAGQFGHQGFQVAEAAVGPEDVRFQVAYACLIGLAVLFLAPYRRVVRCFSHSACAASTSAVRWAGGSG